MYNMRPHSGKRGKLRTGRPLRTSWQAPSNDLPSTAELHELLVSTSCPALLSATTSIHSHKDFLAPLTPVSRPTSQATTRATPNASLESTLDSLDFGDRPMSQASSCASPLEDGHWAFQSPLSRPGSKATNRDFTLGGKALAWMDVEKHQRPNHSSRPASKAHGRKSLSPPRAEKNVGKTNSGNEQKRPSEVLAAIKAKQEALSSTDEGKTHYYVRKVAGKRSSASQPANGLKLPTVQDASAGLAVPTTKPVRRRSRCTAMLEIHDHGMGVNIIPSGIDATGSVEDTIERLKSLQKDASDPKAATALAGVIGELQAGVCQVGFAIDGSVERFVTLHAVRIETSDKNVLMQVGRWRPRHGFMGMCVYPGAKRPTATDFDSYIDFLLRELEPLLEGQEVVRQGSEVNVIKDKSLQFDIQTTYRRILQLATLQPAALTMGPRKSQKSFDNTKDVYLLGPPSTIDGVMVGQSKVTAVMRSPSEVEVYAWVPCALVDRMDEVPEIKRGVRQWAVRFESQLNVWCQSSQPFQG
eukprot:gb/GFBE01032985.1/.p1 GENE.gb/GFBE01032985.1/~~gb/GFBE01032985.1/.p1  ORF type:complete len:527 (+),score=69.25 gb/GFBE01032985.1/:1-1581(+)